MHFLASLSILKTYIIYDFAPRMSFTSAMKKVGAALGISSVEEVEATRKAANEKPLISGKDKELENESKRYFSKEYMNKQWTTVKNGFSSAFNKVFDEDAINLDPQDVPCAYISDRIYLNPFERPRHIFGYELDEKYNDIESALYVNHTTKTWILGYRGTEITELKDYMSDLHILFGTQAWNTRFNASVQSYENAKKAYPDYHSIITGHSLGGTIAYFIAQKFNPDRCVAFNPGSSANPTFAQLIADTQRQKPWTRHVFTYRMSRDPISSLSVI